MMQTNATNIKVPTMERIDYARDLMLEIGISGLEQDLTIMETDEVEKFIANLENEKKMKEEEKEQIHWRPMPLDTYYYVGETPEGERKVFQKKYRSTADDIWNYNDKNCFKTKNEAEKELERVNALENPLPCPFCGSHDIAIQKSCLGMWRAWCLHCFCGTMQSRSRDTVIKEWNNRVK